IAEVGLFGTAFFDSTGIWHGASWIVISLIAAAVIAAVAYAEVKIATRSLLVIEALSVTLITILIVWIYAKVIGGSAPNGQGFADAVNFGAMVSAFASALGTAAASSRILFALGRDGFITRRLGDASARTGAPANALVVIMFVAVATVVGLRINGTSSTNVF